jgi:formylglycine-generating enzyme required for sulfatase activity
MQAQISVKEGSFKQVGQFYTMKDDMTDDNYAPYAVIRIKTENMTSEQVEKLGFQGDARTFFDVEFHDTEVWVYLTYLASYLKITHPDLSSTEFTIPYDMEPLQGYEIVLVNGAVASSAGRGSLTVTTVPEGAALVINGVSMGTTPYYNDLMAAGRYEITVSMNDYQTATRTVDITDKADVTVKIPMDLLIGQLKVESKPAGATVYVDGVRKGVTPLLINDVAIGEHNLRFEKDGYVTKEEDAMFYVDQRYTFEVVMMVACKTKSFTVKGVTFEMIEVEGGTYMMGATKEQEQYAHDNEKPVHEVTVDRFYIGKYEVTENLWNAVMNGKKPIKGSDGEMPKIGITWNDAQVFIQKLNKITKSKFRLPTEAEWQYAARGGKANNGFVYSGGNNLEMLGWYNGNATKIHQVAMAWPNELGLYDMSGNVIEFCSDYYGSYSAEKQVNPKGPATGNKRVVVGGSYSSGSKLCRVSSRIAMAPDKIYGDCGFRLVLEP